MAYKVLAVLRASTFKQEVDSQKMELGNYLHNLGFLESEIRYESYKGASASKANKAYLAMIDEIKTILTTTEIKSVAFWHLNRLGRMEKYLNEMKAWFIEHHIQVYLNNPSMQLLKSNGEIEMSTSMVWSMFGILIEEDTRELLAKLKRGKEYNKQLGNYNGGHTYPYGFKVVDKKVVPDYEKGRIISKLYSLYADGQSMNYLQEYMKSQGEKYGRAFICNLLKQEQYKDVFVDEDLYNKVQEHKAECRNQGKVKRFLFGQGLLTCCECGKHYTNVQGSWTCIYHSYIYRNSSNYCSNSITVNEKYVKYILWRVTSLAESMEIIKSKAERLKNIDYELAELPHLILVQQRILDSIQSRKDKVADLYIDGVIDKKKMAQRLKVIEKEENDASTKKADLNHKLLELNKQKEELGDSTDNGVIMSIVDAKNYIDGLDDIEKYKLVHKWIEDAKVWKYKDCRIVSVKTKETANMTEFVMRGFGAGVKLYIYRHPNYKTIKEDFNEKYLELIPKANIS